MIPQQMTDEKIFMGRENPKSHQPKEQENVNSIMKVSPMKCGSWSPQRCAGIIFTLNLKLRNRNCTTSVTLLDTIPQEIV
jgi:hypothetical protein